MFHRVTCPTCQHKFTVREASMGQRQTCPNCQSHFLAGKSVAEEEAPISMKLQTPAAGAPLNKTMLGETEAPIKFNCPRCKKPLESPSIEAGTKKPCPACGQRLQVPAAPKPAPQPQPALNKTMLAADESTTPSSAIQAGAPIPSATMLPNAATTAPARAPLSKYALAGIAAGGLLVLTLLVCVISMFFSGSADREKYQKAQQDFANAQKLLDDMKKIMQDKEDAMKKQIQLELDKKKEWDRLLDEQKARQRELDLQRKLDEKNQQYQNDQELAAKIKEKRRKEQEELDRQERDRLAQQKNFELQMKTSLESLKMQLDAANQKAQQATIIVSQPPPVYYPPYHPRYFLPGW